MPWANSQRSGFSTAGLLLMGIAAALAAGLLPVALRGLSGASAAMDAYTLRVLTFTLLQASLSTLLSLALGMPAGLALARRHFPGREVLLSLLALPMALPQIVVVLGLIGLFGAEGWFAGLWPLYGLSGILLAHVFFNAALVARLTVTTLQSTPAEHYRLAAQLGFSDLQHFLKVDWPVMRQALPGIALLVFLLCAASFTIVLTLGGGPQATTLEAAIYQSLRSDYDPARATGLALLQLALCLVFGLGVLRFAGVDPQGTRLRLAPRRYDGTALWSRVMDTTSIIVLAALLGLPLLSLLTSGLSAFTLPTSFVRATITSITFATCTAVITCTMAWILAFAAARDTRFNRWGLWASVAGIALPPAVMATGWFILAINTTGLATLAPLLIIALNSLVALPFAYRTLLPEAQSTTRQDRLAASLNLRGYTLFRLDLRAMKRALTLAFAMAFALSLGDLAAVLFFGDGHYLTLPGLIYQQMGSYRMDGAMATALVLTSLALACLVTAERTTRHA